MRVTILYASLTGNTARTFGIACGAHRRFDSCHPFEGCICDHVSECECLGVGSLPVFAFVTAGRMIGATIDALVEPLAVKGALPVASMGCYAPENFFRFSRPSLIVICGVQNPPLQGQLQEPARATVQNCDAISPFGYFSQLPSIFLGVRTEGQKTKQKSFAKFQFGDDRYYIWTKFNEDATGFRITLWNGMTSWRADYSSIPPELDHADFLREAQDGFEQQDNSGHHLYRLTPQADGSIQLTWTLVIQQSPKLAIPIVINLDQMSTPETLRFTRKRVDNLVDAQTQLKFEVNALRSERQKYAALLEDATLVAQRAEADQKTLLEQLYGKACAPTAH
ncbi:hypothetical protein PAPYR_946 [Paratrimastix pyriformis]|uniref:Uncharacterized protein n=1 Tax=Paratrimastix pyriformis TaxID=342808 RepID=A0ABQ8UXN3_9EUKA|nr:hypothetical protein PAPYR_946 [Paratrimastix pyriformis]